MTAFTGRAAGRRAASMVPDMSRKADWYQVSSSLAFTFGFVVVRPPSVAPSFLPNPHRLLQGIDAQVVVATVVTSRQGRLAGLSTGGALAGPTR